MKAESIPPFTKSTHLDYEDDNNSVCSSEDSFFHVDISPKTVCIPQKIIPQPPIASKQPLDSSTGAYVSLMKLNDDIPASPQTHNKRNIETDSIKPDSERATSNDRKTVRFAEVVEVLKYKREIVDPMDQPNTHVSSINSSANNSTSLSGLIIEATSNVFGVAAEIYQTLATNITETKPYEVDSALGYSREYQVKQANKNWALHYEKIEIGSKDA